MEDKMIDVRSVSFAYRKKPPLFESLEWNLEPGTIYGLLGRNGAGKTTLLKLLTGMLFRRTGSVAIDGIDPERRLPELQQEMLFVSEELPVPPMSITAYRDLYAPLYPRFDDAGFTRYLEGFETDPAESMKKMSFGQRKKALLAFGLATGTKLLILDEPTNGLDIPSKGQFRRVLAGAADDTRVIIVSTHQVRDLEQLIDPITILEAGRIIFQHSVDEITSRLRVHVGPDRPENAVYAEQAMGGFASLVPNTDASTSRIDLELLFNAATIETERLSELFAKEAS
ncbi:MAG: ABC transporter ATP-binding protein [Spirochaetaceae bacterium]|nr:MAG: ABC transporter ATP-binding protein [Spirochaetaceae bacterium]